MTGSRGSRGSRRSPGSRRFLGRVIVGAAVAATLAFSLGPFLWMVLTSLKTEAQITAVPPVWKPAGDLRFYRIAILEYGLFNFVRNSIVVAGSTVAVNLALATLAGYALSRLHVPGRRLWLGLLLVVSMFPQVVIAGPVWQILRSLGLLNTFGGLIVPYVALTLPLSIWVLASFFRDLPADLEESARVDGCTGLGALFRVVLPVAAPGLFTAAILVFIYAWNEFFFALIVMTEPGRQTLPVGIALFQGEYTVPWGEIAAASTVATVPLVAMVLLFQRRIISGLSAGAIKG
jgi:multiple sugar transport system permease protein